MAIQVQAKETGFYGGILRHAGDVFRVGHESELGRWMEILSPVPVDGEDPLPGMRAGELIAFAAARGLDIGGLVHQSGKEKILAAVRAALAAGSR